VWYSFFADDPQPPCANLAAAYPIDPQLHPWGGTEEGSVLCPVIGEADATLSSPPLLHTPGQTRHLAAANGTLRLTPAFLVLVVFFLSSYYPLTCRHRLFLPWPWYTLGSEFRSLYEPPIAGFAVCLYVPHSRLRSI
jgi:hypothetical protein